jgi:HSP20 family protein
VRSERRFEPREGDEVVVAERPHGTHTRQLFLADTLDSENVQANYEHGVLTLTRRQVSVRRLGSDRWR